MAKVRIGFSTQFELENELVGIGTDNPTNTLQALGNIRSSDAKAIGVSTFTTFDGFTDTKLSLQGSAGAKQHTTSGEIIIEGEVTVSTGTTFTSGPENLTVTDSFTLPGISDDKPSVGTTRFNENLRALEFYTGVEWKAVNSYVDMGNAGSRGVIYLGSTGISPATSDHDDRIDYINIATLGDSNNFGNLSVSRFNAGGCSSESRGLFGGGQIAPAKSDVIDYVAIQSEGNATDFGNLSAAGRCPASASSSTRGLFAGVNATNVIDYVEIVTTGNASDFGDLTNSSGHKSGACSSPTRFLYHSGSTSPRSGLIEYLTIASKGNTNTFGDLTYAGNGFEGARQTRATSNQVRGIFAGGYQDISPYPTVKNINYVTIASEGNALDFGELTTPRYSLQTTGSQTRGIFAGGAGAGPGFVNEKVIDYIEYASTGNAMVFGDLSDYGRNGSGLSDSHGGLGGF